MELVHGTDQEWTPHLGLCLTDDEDAARDYAVYANNSYVGQVIHWVDVDLSGLTIIEVDDYDPIDNIACGDRDDHYDADVIVFADETIRGRAHRTWRLVSQRGLDAIEHLCTEEAE